MRFKSETVGGFTVYAVSGTNTVSFAIDKMENADTAGLLGFAVERVDPTENERYFMRGFKVFESIVPQPDRNTVVSTFDHPIQSLVWDDFTAKPGQSYEYLFYPIKGPVKNLDRSAESISIQVETEPLNDEDAEHAVFFNRGVASSQAYARKFGNLSPDALEEKGERELAEAAWKWLTRDLEGALLQFIGQAERGDTLRACLYEFRYAPVAKAFKDAIDRGVDVRLILDGKENGHYEKVKGKKKWVEAFPRTDNMAQVKANRIPAKNILWREAAPGFIQHNKFIVYLKGAAKKPESVWTGSTNISRSGLFGQTNVGHWIRNGEVAEKYREYWNLLSGDPGGVPEDGNGDKIKKNKEFRAEVVKIQADLDAGGIPAGVTALFSPRSNGDMLETYSKLLDGAAELGAITLAFGINKIFKTPLQDNSPNGAITFFLLEKEDKANPKKKDEFIEIGAKNNVYKAWGSFIDDPVYNLVRETNARKLDLSNHVAYIHSKFMLQDPLSEDPIVVTGSANFSEPSIKENDENMLVIRGDLRVADLYFTEFNRLFNHYYFRSVYESLGRGKGRDQNSNIFLAEDDSWLDKYKPGKLRQKRVKVFSRMQGITEASLSPVP